MNMFFETFGFVAALCAGVIILALFFTGLGYFKLAIRETGVVAVGGFVRYGKQVNVYLRDGHITRKVRFIGFSESSSANGTIPHQLSCMAVFEAETGSQLLIRPDSIKMIEEVAETV